MFARIGRTFCGFIAQYLGVLVSVNVFATPGGTIFWWTQSAITIAAMVLTPDKYWPERIVHVATGVAAYVPFRYRKFSVPLLAAVCLSNSLGQAFGYASMKRFFPDLTVKEVGTLRFLGAFLVFPVILASLVASIPGSLAFYFLGTDVVLSSVIVNYTLGHISGTAALLYPLLIVPTMWENRLRSYNPLAQGTSVFVVVTFLCSFTNYYMCGFATIVAMYGLFIGVSAYIDQCDASLIQLACTGSVLGLTAAGRGPFVYVIQDGGTESLLIGTQMGTAALTALSAFVVIVVSQLRVLEKSERDSRRRAEEVAERQTLDLFRIGHDMNNNSSLIQAICEMSGENLDKNTLETVKAINTLSGVLVSDMVDMVNGKEAQQVVSREDIDIVEILEIYSMVATGLLLLEGKESSIVIRVKKSDSDNLVAYTNRERVHQIMCNLVSNAVKYTESGDIVLEVAGCSDGTLKVHVADSGIGLSEAELSKVFDLFFRSGRASQMNSGTGLGLSNVKRICSAIDAKIEVSSLGEGRGSTFTLVLPRRCSDDAQLGGQVPTRFSLRVLVMDDSAVIRKLMSRYLTSFGCEVIGTSSAEESRALLCEGKHEKFDAVITDSSMGGESGLEFINSVRKGGVQGLPKLLPCILCSGESHDLNDPRTVSITKPFSPNDVAAALNLLNLSADEAKV